MEINGLFANEKYRKEESLIEASLTVISGLVVGLLALFILKLI